MTGDQVLERWRHKALTHGAELLFNLETAREVVADCTRSRVPVIGIEAFDWSGSDVRPRMDQIADFSDRVVGGCDQRCVEGCNADALAFLAQLPRESLIVSFVLGEGSQ
jgi:hypothetical protein